MTGTREITPAAIARLLGVSKDFVYDEIARGRLKARKVTFPSGRIRLHVAQEDFDAYRLHGPQQAA